MFKKMFEKFNEQETRKANEYDLHLSTELDITVRSLKKVVGESNDIVQRDILIGGTVRAVIFFIEGMSREETIVEKVIVPLQDIIYNADVESIISTIHETIPLPSVNCAVCFDEAILPFLAGDSLLAVDGTEKLFVIGTKGFEERGVNEPESEIVIRGPRDGFTENIKTNTVLLRRRIRDPNLIVQFGKVGRRSKKEFAIMYIKGIVQASLVEEVRYRLACIDADEVAETGTLEQLIEDNVLSPFPQILHTERPDKATVSLNNGQVVILLDGTPFVLLTPITLNQLFKSPEDYYDRWQISSLIRILRYAAAFISLFLPSIYIAMVSFHQGMIPSTLALSIAGAREGVPFPSFVEALLMEFTIELLREAGIRLPRPVGQTIGIVGGLVIGEAAVRAGIVNPIMIIVVALTAIASFAIPAYSFSITLRMVRFAFMILAASFGLYGIIIAYITLCVHLVGLKSFGTYYASPFAPYKLIELLDTIVRMPLTVNKNRTEGTNPDDIKKQS